MRFFGKTLNELVYSISWRLPSWIFYYYHTLLVKSDNPRLPTRKFKTYFLKPVTEEEIPLLVKYGIKEELIRNRLKSGDKCVIMGKDKKIQTIIWGASSKKYLRLSGAILDPGPDGAIIYAGYTTPDARMKGLFAVAFNEIYQSYIAEGRSVLYGAIDTYNKNSLKLHLRMNFKIVGETYFSRLFGIKICYYKSWPYPVRKLHIFIKEPPDGLEWI